MFVSDNNQKMKTKAGLFIILLTFASLSMYGSADEKLGLGQAASVEEIKGWDIDIRPDGKGLPEGSGDAAGGEDVFIQKCASCHGEFAEGAGRYPVLAGGIDSLDTHDPVKTVGSYWPYASTVFDYIKRAMPFGHAKSLSDDEVYAMTAYILYSNEIIEEDFMLNQNTLALVEMPNRNGFIADDRPDVPVGEPCMNNCLSKAPEVIGRARHIDVTPEEEAVSDASDVTAVGDPTRGEAVFGQCAACHSMNEGENKFGPSLHAIYGRKAGSLDSFSNYSGAVRSASITWTEENLRDFLSMPQQFLPGTTMPFAGLKDAIELADLLAFLKKSSD